LRISINFPEYISVIEILENRYPACFTTVNSANQAHFFNLRRARNMRVKNKKASLHEANLLILLEPAMGFEPATC